MNAAAAAAAAHPTLTYTYCARRKHHVVRAAKDLHFNKNMEALKKMQAGADKLATVVGVTLGPKVRVTASCSGVARAGCIMQWSRQGWCALL